MSELNDFTSNPPAFMRRNHVRFRGACTLAAGAAGRFELMRVVGRNSARTRKLFLGMAVGRTDAGVFEIRQARIDNFSGNEVLGSFEAVWGGYQSGGAAQCTLGAQGANIMLTPELTGCTVVAAPGVDGNARFSHYNLRDPGQAARTLPADGMRARAAQDYAGSRHAVLTKEDYYGRATRGGSGHATVIGWRDGAAWRFWIQYVEENGDIFRIRDVQQMRAGTRFG